MSNWKVAAYYTDNYREYATNLVSSMAKFNIPGSAELIADMGGWRMNTSHKPAFLLEQINNTSIDILYMDADAEFRKYPVLFDNIEEDVALYRGSVWAHSGIETLSGTVYLKNNKKVKDMLEIWSIRCKANPEVWDQVHLAQAIEDKALSMKFLPVEYCMIFDSPHASGKDPYIIHNQASRKTRR